MNGTKRYRRIGIVVAVLLTCVAGGWWVRQPSAAERELIGYWRGYDPAGLHTHDLRLLANGTVEFRSPRTFDSDGQAGPATYYEPAMLAWWITGDQLCSGEPATLRHYWQRLRAFRLPTQPDVDDGWYKVISRNEFHYWMEPEKADSPYRFERIAPETPPLAVEDETFEAMEVIPDEALPSPAADASYDASPRTDTP